jgi:hypothetical protein
MSTHPYRSTARRPQPASSKAAEDPRGLGLASAIIQVALFLLCALRLWVAAHRAFGFEGGLALVLGLLLVASWARRLSRSCSRGGFV